VFHPYLAQRESFFSTLAHTVFFKAGNLDSIFIQVGRFVQSHIFVIKGYLCRRKTVGGDEGMILKISGCS